MKAGNQEKIEAPTDRFLWAKRVLVFGLIAATWLGSVYLARVGFADLKGAEKPWELTAILFGAAQVCLFVISIIIGFLAIFGFQYFEGKIREAVERETANRLAKVEKEARGRSFAIQGYLIGENSVTEDFTQPTNEERLQEAIAYCDQAYAFLKGTDLPVEFMALNNFLGYSCALRNTSRRGHILDCARRLREAAEAHDSQNLLLTYSRAILVFSLEPSEIAEACSIIEDIKSSTRLNKKQKREAEYLSSLCKDRRVPVVTR